MAPFVPKSGDYIVFSFLDDPSKADEKETKYGRFVKFDANKLVYRDSDDPKKDVTIAAGKFVPTSVKKSLWAKMQMQAKPNAREALENSALFMAYSSIFMKNDFLGAENVSFLVAEGIHEFLLKGMLAGLADMLGPTELKKDAGEFFKSEDFTEPARRIGFVLALQQISQRMLFKKSWGHQVVSNLLGGYSCMALTNVVDRMWNVDDDAKTPDVPYAYP